MYQVIWYDQTEEFTEQDFRYLLERNKMIVTPEVVTKVYDKVISCTELAQTAGIKYVNAKESLEKKVLTATAGGLIVGKNETIRSAAAYEMFKVEYAEVSELERIYTEAKNSLELANIELSKVRALIRIAELSTQPEVITGIY